MTLSARVTVTGMGRAVTALGKLRYALGRPRPGLFRATNKVAELWGVNYDQEGSMVGGWADLAARTQAERAKLGFGAAHPILFRYGALYGVTIDMFAHAQQNAWAVAGDGDARVGGALTVSNNTATLYAVGWPIANQWEDSRHPARPYWFVDQRSVAAAKVGVEEWLGEVIRDLPTGANP